MSIYIYIYILHMRYIIIIKLLTSHKNQQYYLKIMIILDYNLNIKLNILFIVHFNEKIKIILKKEPQK